MTNYVCIYACNINYNTGYLSAYAQKMEITYNDFTEAIEREGDYKIYFFFFFWILQFI